MITKRVAADPTFEDVLTVRVKGAHDIYRFARHLEHGQVEFAAVGRKTLASLRRRLGRARFKQLADYLEGRTNW